MRAMKRALMVALGIAGMLALSACGSGAGSANTLPTATSGSVRLATDKTSYSVNEPIGVTLQNTSGTTYYAINGHAGCTFLVLQQLQSGSGTWQDMSHCDQNEPPESLAIDGNQTEPFTLTPWSAGDQNAWASGTYRVAIATSTSANGKTSMSYSNGFKIHS